MPYGRGLGFRGSSPGWPYVGRGRGGLPRCWAYGPYPYGAAFGEPPLGYGPWQGAAMAPGFGSPTVDDEKQMLRQQADLLKRQIDEINQRIEVLEQAMQEGD